MKKILLFIPLLWGFPIFMQWYKFTSYWNWKIKSLIVYHVIVQILLMHLAFMYVIH